ncbi:hypothetical protein N7535_000573 [Penicillium sp. DV-2018c]|nr:hypothetical protein N7461_006178 [Penicillium sp. DV-2018c]KAJ5581953.1 hypothetical protein N7535_000573 [Penicillium sp. DV-2018c]
MSAKADKDGALDKEKLVDDGRGCLHSNFGQWKADKDADVKHIDMSMMEKELSEHAPFFSNLMTELAFSTNIRRQGYVRQEEERYLRSGDAGINIAAEIIQEDGKPLCTFAGILSPRLSH